MNSQNDKKQSNTVEAAWLTGEFIVSMNVSGKPQEVECRLYAYPSNKESYPAEVRYAFAGESQEQINVGFLSISKNTLTFSERSDMGKPGNPELIDTLVVHRVEGDLFEGKPENNGGIFAPDLALKIASIPAMSPNTQAGRARNDQQAHFMKQGTPVIFRVTQYEPDLSRSTVH